MPLAPKPRLALHHLLSPSPRFNFLVVVFRELSPSLLPIFFLHFYPSFSIRVYPSFSLTFTHPFPFIFTNPYPLSYANPGLIPCITSCPLLSCVARRGVLEPWTHVPPLIYYLWKSRPFFSRFFFLRWMMVLACSTKSLRFRACSSGF